MPGRITPSPPPPRCTNFSNLFWEWNSTCFRQSLCPSSGAQHCKQLASSQHNLYDIYLSLCLQCWTLDDGQRDYPKHVEFHSKNKFDKLVHFVGFVIRICQDARTSECQKSTQRCTQRCNLLFRPKRPNSRKIT